MRKSHYSTDLFSLSLLREFIIIIIIIIIERIFCVSLFIYAFLVVREFMFMDQINAELEDLSAGPTYFLASRLTRYGPAAILNDRLLKGMSWADLFDYLGLLGPVHFSLLFAITKNSHKIMILGMDEKFVKL